MEILGLEKVSFVDYEGKICATIFTGGCNFFCPFCHNSGLVKREVQPIEQRDVLDYLRSRTNLLEAVTISGGEPTLQPDLEDFIVEVKKMGYLVKLDTNGTNPYVLRNLINKNLIDYVALDIKNNFADYSKITEKVNVPVDKIKESVNILSNSSVKYELRTTLVNEFHDIINIEKMADDLEGQNVLYLQKFVDSGSCIGSNLNAVDKNKALIFKEILSSKIKNVYLRGYN